ncbi:hypothetical protein D3C75_225630 [compost metagenome]
MNDAFSHHQLPASAWLDVLSTICPVTGVMVIGAGTGNGPWVEWLHQRKVRPVWLLEGEQKQFQHLQRNFPADVGWLLYQKIVISGKDTPYFYQASNPCENGLMDPLLLKSVWPNLHSLHHKPVSDGVTLQSFMQVNTCSVNWLVIDCLPAAPLLSDAQGEIEQLDIVIVRVLLDDEPISASLIQVDLIMTNAGMRRLHLLSERHPSLAFAIYVKDQSVQQLELKKEISHLRIMLESAKNKNDELRLNYELRLEKIKTEFQDQEIQRLREECESQTQILLKIESFNKTERAKQQLSIEQIIATIDKLHLQSNHEYQTLKNLDDKFGNEVVKRKEDQQLLISLNKAEQDKQQLLIEKALSLTNENYRQQEKHNKEWPNVLKRELINRLGNSVRQIESFLTIQSYLATGDGIANFHGWPISADIGLFLIEKIRERQYDSIIEFGSGTSTLLMAKALKSLNIINNGETKRIITFEHNADYYLQTQKQLNLHKVDDIVDLCLTPLKEWDDPSGKYRYYDCRDNLKKLANKLNGGKKKILVLVDGPPGDTCAHARYPAGPFLLELSKEHEIDWVLDDAYRAEEINSANLWKDIWTEKNIPFTDELIKNEKGMFFSTTNKQ